MKTPIPAALLTAAALCVALPALGQSLGERTGVNAALGITPATQDFVSEAAQSNMFEIESSRLALERASNPAIKNFAQQMIADHSKTTQELKTLVANANMQATLPVTLDKAHTEMLDPLKTATGGEFNAAYRKAQVTAHESAVSLFKRYADGGDLPALKQFAAQTLPALQHHLEMAQSLAK